MYDIYAKIFKAKIHYIDYNASLNGPTLDIDKFYRLIDLKKSTHHISTTRERNKLNCFGNRNPYVKLIL